MKFAGHNKKPVNLHEYIRPSSRSDWTLVALTTAIIFLFILFNMNVKDLSPTLGCQKVLTDDRG